MRRLFTTCACIMILTMVCYGQGKDNGQQLIDKFFEI